MGSTVQRFRFIFSVALSILLLTIVGTAFLQSAYAPPPPPPTTFTLNVSPNPVLPNQPVTFSGQVNPLETSTGDQIAVVVISGEGTSCILPADIGFIQLTVNLVPAGITLLGPFTGTTNNLGAFTIVATGGFAVGPYTVIALDRSYTAISAQSPCDPLTVSTVIPEYPFGLALLAVLMIIAYGAIRRKTRYDHN